MWLRRYCLVLVLVCCFIVLDTQTVKACSGGAPLTVSGLLKYSDYAIEATVTETDDVGQNVILQVERYLSGGQGSQYLVLKGKDPIFVNYTLAGRSSGGDCLGLYPSFRAGDRFYTFVSRNLDGSYSLIFTLFNSPYYAFRELDSTVEVFLEGSQIEGDDDSDDYADRNMGKKVDETEFVAIIEEWSGESPVAPIPDSPYPLKAPVMISTNDDNQNLYMLPVDWKEPVPLTPEMLDLANHPMWGFGFSDAGRCDANGCMQISPDNLNIAVQGGNEIRFTWGHTVEGQDALFSNPSDTVAVWNQCDLAAFTTGYPRLGQDWYELEQIASVTLTASDQGGCLSLHQGAWSPDGRILAFSDADGLWLWDVYSESIPERLITSEDTIPLARYFSPLGRYLAVSQGDTHYTIDVMTGLQFPDGVISPDDRILLKYDTASRSSDLEICSLTPFHCQDARGMYVETFNNLGERTRLYESQKISKVTWLDQSKFFALSCIPDEPDQCSIYIWSPRSYGWELPFQVSRGFDFD